MSRTTIRLLSTARAHVLTLMTLLALALWGLPAPAVHAAAPTVCNGSSCFSSLQAAINAATTGDTLTLGAGELTEAGIVVNKNLTIRGAGDDKTIVQAAATAGTASNRVVTVNGGVTATLQNLTVRHGKSATDYGGEPGGGILNQVMVATAAASSMPRTAP